MTRARHFLKGLGSGYLLLAVNALATFISFPVALHYLSRPEFEVWIVVGQTVNYLAMIDLGTTSAGVRLLVDYKDSRAGGAYGSMIKSMVLAQWVQAVLILITGLAAVPLLKVVLEIPPALVQNFSLLWRWQVFFLAINFALRIGNLILMAHQRLDVSNYTQIGYQILNFLILITAFHFGFGLYSLILAQGAAMMVMLLWMLTACVRLELLPPPGAWGAVSTRHLRSLFGFGSEVFLVALGSQFINSTQVILLTRLQGFDAAALWGVMTKLFTLLTQLVWRAVGVASPAFSEMMVRGEQELLRRRYRSVFEISVLASCFFGLLIGLGNNAFMELWTKGRFQWPAINNWLLAVWFVLLTQVSCHTALVLSAKQVRAVKFIYFLEGVVFIGLAWLAIPRAGISGMLACSIICTAGFTLAYNTWRVTELLQVPTWKALLEWLSSSLRFLVMTLPIGALLALFTRHLPVERLAGCVLPVALVGTLVALRYCVPRELTVEFISHLPKWSRRPASRLAGHRDT